MGSFLFFFLLSRKRRSVLRVARPLFGIEGCDAFLFSFVFFLTQTMSSVAVVVVARR